jgi:filamentous hemagglutinin
MAAETRTAESFNGISTKVDTPKAGSPKPEPAPPASPGGGPARDSAPPTVGGTKSSGASPAPAAESAAGGSKIVVDANGNSRLTNADQATMDPNKFTGYALNPDHPVGGNKARVFAAATGFTKDNAGDLIAQIKQGITENPPKPGKVDKWGERFTVEIPVTGPTGSGVVTTGWIYKPGETTPSLTTLLMKGGKK